MAYDDDEAGVASEVGPDRKPFVVADDVLMYGVLPVGQITDNGRLLTLNLGWMRLAGLSVRVEDDPQVDRHRDGVTLQRDYGDRA